MLINLCLGRHFEPITQLLVKGWGNPPSTTSTSAGNKKKTAAKKEESKVEDDMSVPSQAFVQHGPLFLLATTNYRICKENIRKIFSGKFSLLGCTTNIFNFCTFGRQGSFIASTLKKASPSLVRLHRPRIMLLLIRLHHYSNPKLLRLYDPSWKR